MIIRPIGRQDLDTLQQIAVESGPGFTSLMDDRDFLAEKIEHAIESFQKPVTEPGQESYLFVLEDSETGEVIGTTGIEAAVGLDAPLYHYHRSQVVHHSRDLDLFKRIEVLNLCNHYTGCSEICTLYLRPRFRRPFAGKLLSKVRFLFMAQHAQRFAPTVIAEMRGVSSDTGQSPFWDWFRTHFVDLDFATANRLVGAGNKRFIAELMPKYPLYTHLLSAQAQAVIGRVHDETRPALHMLESEGFRHTGYVDLFDGGPSVEAQRDQIRSVAQSVQCPVQIIDRQTPVLRHSAQPGAMLAIANTEVAGFRAGITDQALYLPEQQTLQVPVALATKLQLTNGAVARFIPLTSAQSIQADAPLAAQQTHQQEYRYAF